MCVAGFVVSDYDAWAEIWGTHHQGGDAEGGAAKGLNAGIDQEGGGHSAVDQLAQVQIPSQEPHLLFVVACAKVCHSERAGYGPRR
jgi:beta-glucosidase-like glycosyl hydrolase